jgi:hypothetical protein
MNTDGRIPNSRFKMPKKTGHDKTRKGEASLAPTPKDRQERLSYS